MKITVSPDDETNVSFQPAEGDAEDRWIATVTRFSTEDTEFKEKIVILDDGLPDDLVSSAQEFLEDL